MKINLFILPLVLFFTITAYAAPGKMYRWHREDGSVFYADHVQPDDSKYKRESITKSGAIIDDFAGVKTKSEITEEDKINDLRVIQSKLINDQQNKDTLLLNIYETDQSIVAAYEKRVGELSYQQSMAQRETDKLKLQLSALHKDASDYQRDNKDVPKSLVKQINSKHVEIQESFVTVSEFAGKKDDLKLKLKQDLQRFADLTENKKAQGAIQEDVSVKSETMGLFVCSSEAQCDKAWGFAKYYVEQNSLTPIREETKVLILTELPLTENRFGLSTVKVYVNDEFQIFLDAQCKTNSSALCTSDKVKNIKEGFVTFMNGALNLSVK